MARRKKFGEEKSLPRGNIILRFPIPLKFSFSSTNSEYKKIKEKLDENKYTLEQFFHDRFMDFFDAEGWAALEKKNPEVRRIMRDAARSIKDEMGIEDREFSKWFIDEAKEFFKIE